MIPRTKTTGPEPWLRALALAAILLLVQAAGDPARQFLRFSRDGLAAGEWWRLLGAHFTHLGWTHTVLNVLGVLLCCALAPRLFNRYFWPRLASLALGVGLLLWWLSPGVSSYVGLSGVLYGLFSLGLFSQARHGDYPAGVALTVIAAWMLWQWLAAPLASEEALIGGRIVAISHVYGFCLGLCMVAAQGGWRRLFHGDRNI